MTHTTTTSAGAPIACSLSAADYGDRLAGMRALAARALTGRVPIPGGERLTFAAGEGVETALRAFVAAEARCCPFLSFDVTHEDDDDGALVLTVTAPDGAAPIIAELFA